MKVKFFLLLVAVALLGQEGQARQEGQERNFEQLTKNISHLKENLKEKQTVDAGDKRATIPMVSLESEGGFSGYRRYFNYEVRGLKSRDEAEDQNEVFYLEFDLDVEEGYHLNSANPLDNFLIPTQLTVMAEGWNTVVEFPPGKVRKLREDVDMEVSLYEGRDNIILVKVSRVSGNLLENKQNKDELINFSYRINYQACTDEVCYPPDTVISNVSISLDNLAVFVGTNLMTDLSTTLTTKVASSSPDSVGLGIGSFSEFSIWAWLFGFTLLGGLLLNFMPCVLPVASLKLFSLAQMKKSEEGGDELSRVRRQLFYYGLGVLLTFGGLGLMVVLLKSLGESVGWGFQFQNPYYLIAMVILLFFMGLSLLGIINFSGFSLQLGINLKDSSEAKQANNGRGIFLKEIAHQLFLGFLTVLMATPCLAPFLGVAAGLALSQSAVVIVGFYLTIALGFLLPYGCFYLNPRLLILPKPGRWMEWLKQLLAFPIFIAMIWLLTLLETITSFTAVYQTSLLVLLVSFVGMVYGKVAGQKRFFKIGVLVVGGLVVGFSFRQVDVSHQAADKAVVEAKETLKYFTADYSSEAVETVVNHRGVALVHFTADWCLNCKVNQKLVLEKPETEKLLNLYKVKTFKADWTKTDVAILKEIKRLGRAGIPLDVFYYFNEEEGRVNNLILGEILSFGQIEDSLIQINKSKKYN